MTNLTEIVPLCNNNCTLLSYLRVFTFCTCCILICLMCIVVTLSCIVCNCCWLALCIFAVVLCVLCLPSVHVVFWFASVLLLLLLVVLCVIVVGWPCVLLLVVLFVLLSCYVYLLYYVCIAVFTLDAGLLARNQYSEGPATGHLDTGFSWFPCVHKQMLRWFPKFQVATTCFSWSPPDLNLLLTNFMSCLHLK